MPLLPPAALVALLSLLSTTPALAAAGPAAPRRTMSDGASSLPRFDGEAALRWVNRQCNFGPRTPGTAGHAAALADFRAYFDSLGLECTSQVFETTSPLDGAPLVLTNLIVRVRPEIRPRLLLGAHWDTRPIADLDPDPARRRTPIVGANDGASGVAVLTVLAEMLRAQPPPIGVDLVLFDGEDLGRPDRPEEFCLGSQWMVENWFGPWPDAVLILDMVGAPGAVFPREDFAHARAREWVELPFEIAKRKGFQEWDLTTGYSIIDDHVPFLGQGVPASVLIGWGDPAWHTTGDTPERLSSQVLGRVGEVVTELIYGGYLAP